MGLIILIVVGGILGWLATIILRIEDVRGILVSVAAGIFGSVAVGLLAGKGVFLGAVSASALLWAALGAIVLIALVNFVKERALR